MIVPSIEFLKDLDKFRSAPELHLNQIVLLRNELNQYMHVSDWFTVGIMAPSKKIALLTIREIENLFNWHPMKVVSSPEEEGPVFLKANQKTGDIYLRIEYGLGEGVLLTCQNYDSEQESLTFGPFPFDFFKIKE